MEKLIVSNMGMGWSELGTGVESFTYLTNLHRVSNNQLNLKHEEFK